MNIKQYIDDINEIQHNILEYIEKEDDEEENFQNIISSFECKGTTKRKYEIKLVFRTLLKIAQNHHRTPNFFSKIEQILLYFKDEIKIFFTNADIFDIFKNNKRIILFLLEQKLMFIDEYVFSHISSQKFNSRNYHKYFEPEIESYFSSLHEFILLRTDSDKDKDKDDKKIEDKKKFDDFNSKRKKGENENELCQIIQQDLIEEFITLIKKENYSINSHIECSIFETNSFLLKNKKYSLIQYATFFGSPQIAKYLFLNGVKLNDSIWLYAIHGDDAEIIRLLEDKYKVKLENNSSLLFKCILESIKCHHNDITNYLRCNYVEIKFSNYYYKTVLRQMFHYYNTSYFSDYQNKKLFFKYACEYDYFTLVKLFLITKDIDLNEIVI
ncbi:hypothetical protein M9Y10_042244 [Tritrichomonas musculus]|uniref:DUF3447 domain-containing protein n=1 Tax=Tritrichomonas musculus TaxID=1915356 RepID=A0ABR2K6T4_9EUKA